MWTFILQINTIALTYAIILSRRFLYRPWSFFFFIELDCLLVIKVSRVDGCAIMDLFTLFVCRGSQQSVRRPWAFIYQRSKDVKPRQWESKGQGFVLAWSIPSILFGRCKASYPDVMKHRRLLLIFSCLFSGFAQRMGSRPLYCRVLFLQWAVDRLFSFTCHLRASFWQSFPCGWEGFCWLNIVEGVRAQYVVGFMKC